MKDIIVYGYGRQYHKLKDSLNGCRILAIADKKAQTFIGDTAYPFILPERINDFSYDYVAISPLSGYEHIKQQLVAENVVPEEKIISLQLFATPAPDDRHKIILDDFYKWRDGRIPKMQFFTFCPEEEPAGRRMACPGELIIINEAGTADLPPVDIYVVTHKEYGVLDEGVYKPLTVGGYTHPSYLSETDGNNIAYLNDKLNECTALYWIWKNTASQIVGMNHYRRFFYNNELRCRENRLDAATVAKILSENDMIVYCNTVFTGSNVEEELRADLPADVFDYGYHIITECLGRYRENYLPDFYEVMKGHTCCYCNMFVTKRAVLDEYCEWLFPFLIPAAEMADVSRFDSYDKRVIGFFAERMLSVWLHHNKFKTYSLPVYIP